MVLCTHVLTVGYKGPRLLVIGRCCNRASLGRYSCDALQSAFNVQGRALRTSLGLIWEPGRLREYAGKAAVDLGGTSTVGQAGINFAFSRTPSVHLQSSRPAYIAIQLVKLSGSSSIISTASLRNTTLVHSFGTTRVVNRTLPRAGSCGKRGPIELVYDVISVAQTGV